VIRWLKRLVYLQFRYCRNCVLNIPWEQGILSLFQPACFCKKKWDVFCVNNRWTPSQPRPHSSAESVSVHVTKLKSKLFNWNFQILYLKEKNKVLMKFWFIVENCDCYKIFISSLLLFSVYALKHWILLNVCLFFFSPRLLSVIYRGKK
jgi:hypothetical protein